MGAPALPKPPPRGAGRPARGALLPGARPRAASAARPTYSGGLPKTSFVREKLQIYLISGMFQRPSARVCRVMTPCPWLTSRISCVLIFIIPMAMACSFPAA